MPAACKMLPSVLISFVFHVAVPCDNIFSAQEKVDARVQKKEMKPLSSAEKSAIRNSVFKGGVGTQILKGGNRVVAVPKTITEIHAKKPMATVVLLHEIVTGAAPKDAIAAAAYLIA